MVAQKSILTITSIMAALIFGGGAYLYMNLGSITKVITERLASDALGVGVTISTLDIDVQNKIIDVGDIRIKNPDGYAKPYVMSIDSIRVQAQTLSKDLLNFQDITVTGTDVYVEVKEGSTNLHTLRDQVANIAAQRKAEKPVESKEGETPVKVIIQNFLLDRAALYPSVTLIQEQDLQPVTIPPIRLTGIGERENGVLVQDAVAQIARHLMKEFNNAAAQSGFLAGMSADTLRDMGLSQVDAVKTRVLDEIDNVGGRLKGMFE